MKDLDLIRKEIDKIDSNIIELYEKRMELVKEVINFKIENNLPVLDESREKIMLEKNLEKIQKEEYKEYYSEVLQGFLKSSKKMQENLLKENEEKSSK